MIAPDEIRILAERPGADRPVVSLFLDLGVTAENKRTHHVFLNKQRSRFAELGCDRPHHHREPVGAFLELVERWLEMEFDESNRGAALYAELGGGWFRAVQLPVRLENRLEISDRPVIEPLAHALAEHPRFAIGLVDREHLRLIASWMGRVLGEAMHAPEPLPVPHDVQAGGYSQKDIQKRKAEEAKQFLRDFAERLAEFDRKHEPQHWIIAGTTENVRHFREGLAPAIEAKVGATAQAYFEASSMEVVQRMVQTMEQIRARTQAEAVERARERLRTGHLAVGGMEDVLEVLQEGKVANLVVTGDAQRRGSECSRCGFLLAAADGECPYCGGEVREGVDLVEAVLRIAARRDVPVEFVDDGALAEARGVGALLAF